VLSALIYAEEDGKREESRGGCGTETGAGWHRGRGRSEGERRRVGEERQTERTTVVVESEAT